MSTHNIKFGNDFNPYKPGVIIMGIGKRNSPRCDAAKRSIPYGAILFAYINFIKK